MRFHISLPVSDIARSTAFYRTLLCAEPVKARIDYAKFLPEALALNLSLHHSPAAVHSVVPVHVGLEFLDRASLGAAHQRLLEAGLAGERTTSVCCYANQDKFWTRDPDGYRWELYVLLEDTEQRMSPDTSCCEAAAPRGC